MTTPPDPLAEYLDYYSLDTRREFPDARHAIGWVASGGERLATQLWLQAGSERNLLLVHGYFDHVGLFGQLVRYGLQRGYNVVAFDLPGHGLSTGPQGVIDRFGSYSQAAVDVLDALAGLEGRWHVIAQSTGAAAIMDLLNTSGVQRLESIVLFAPLLRPRGWWWIRAAHAVIGGRRDHVRRGYAENSHDTEFLEFVRRDPLQARTISLAWIGALRAWLPAMLQRQPVDRHLLVIQGDEDRTVDWKYNLKQIERLFPSVTVRMIPEGRHHLANESEAIRRKINTAMDDWFHCN